MQLKLESYVYGWDSHRNVEFFLGRLDTLDVLN